MLILMFVIDIFKSSKECIVSIHNYGMTVTLCPMTWDGITVHLLFMLCPVSFHTSGGVVLGAS